MLRTRAILCGILLAVVTSAASVAQSPTAANPPADKPAFALLVSMKFPGGSVADYVNALKKAAGNVNIIAAGECKDVPMPPVELTDASINAAINVLDGRAVQLNDRLIKLKLREERSGYPNEQSVYAVDAFVQGRPVDHSMFQRVWSVKRSLNDGTKANDLLTAVQTSLDLLTDAAKPAQLKFHEATGLIIVRASESQIDAIEQVIDQMEGQKFQSGEANEQVQVLELELQKCRLAHQNAEQHVGRLERELAEAKKR